MKYFLKIILVCGLCVISLVSCCKLLSEILGLDGDINIISPEDGSIVPTSSITVEVEATYDFIDEIILEVNGATVHTTSENSFSQTVYLIPDENIITVTCYAYESDASTVSQYAGSDTIYVHYDDQDPVLSITYPENWSNVPSDDVTISGTVDDNYWIEILSYLDNGTWNSISFNDETGAWDFLRSNLSEGTHSYLFKAMDAAGREIVNSVTFTVDLL